VTRHGKEALAAPQSFSDTTNGHFQQTQTEPSCEPLIDANEAARLLKIHPRTIKRMAAKGEIPGKRIGSVWRFRRSLLDAWFEEGIDFSRHLRSEAKGAEK